MGIGITIRAIQSFPAVARCIKAEVTFQNAGGMSAGMWIDIVEAVNEGKEITKADLQRCAKHILSVALKTM
ncbi:MAG: hypothetical protein ACLUVD_12745 [Mediterraneibacter faecis]